MSRVINYAPVVWYVLANQSEAVIYVDGSDRKFHFLHRFKNKDGTKQEQSLVSDRGGSIASSASKSIRHTLQIHETHHEHHAKLFAKEIAEQLENARIDKRYDELVLVAEPRFIGLLRRELSASTKKQVRREVKREYVYGSDLQIRTSVLQAIRDHVPRTSFR